MQVFDPKLAANLQFVTLPLEVIGLALALVEVRFPRTAEWLAGWLAKLAEPVSVLRTAGGEAHADSRLARNLTALLNRVISIALLLVLIPFVISAFSQIRAGEASVGWFIGEGIGFGLSAVIAIVIAVIVSLTLYFSVAAGSDLVQRFVAGRAVGTLGILIAGLGVLGEAYQLVTMLVVG